MQRLVGSFRCGAEKNLWAQLQGQLFAPCTQGTEAVNDLKTVAISVRCQRAGFDSACCARRSLAMPVGGKLEAELGRFAADCSADARADVECALCWLQLASWI